MRPFITWLASYPKTGSTWVRAMLNAYYYGENFHPNRMDLVPGEPSKAFYLGMWTQTKHWDLYDWACMRNVAFVQQWAMSRSLPEFYAIKTHAANLQIHDVSLISPVYTRAAVYIARDPRDVLVSSAKYFRKGYREQWEHMNSDESMINRDQEPIVWQPCSSYRMHLRSWLAQSLTFPVLRVLYEDMLEDPRRELLRILEFMGIGIDQQLVDVALRLSSFGNLRAHERRHGFRENQPAFKKGGQESEPAEPFFRVGTAGQWKTELPKDLADEVYEVLAPYEHLWGKPMEPSSAAA